METYWISGVQLGMLLCLEGKQAKKLINKIMNKQQIPDKVRKQAIVEER